MLPRKKLPQGRPPSLSLCESCDVFIIKSLHTQGMGWAACSRLPPCLPARARGVVAVVHVVRAHNLNLASEQGASTCDV